MSLPPTEFSAPSLDRLPLKEEQDLRTATKAVRKLRTAVRVAEKKLAQFRNAAMDFGRRVVADLAPAQKKLDERAGVFIREAIELCKEPYIKRKTKYEIQTVVLFLLHSGFTSDVPVPEWFCADPTSYDPKRHGSETQLKTGDKSADGIEPTMDEAFSTLSEEMDAEMRRQMEEDLSHQRKLWQGGNSEAPGDDRRKLREIYVRLAQIAHPDLAASEQERERRTALMQRINAAYQSGAVNLLLEIEQSERTVRTRLAAVTNSGFAQDELRELVLQEDLLKRQLERLRQDLRDLKSSPPGEAYRHFVRTSEGNKSAIDSEVVSLKARADSLEEAMGIMNTIRKQKKDGGALRRCFRTHFEELLVLTELLASEEFS